MDGNDVVAGGRVRGGDVRDRVSADDLASSAAGVPDIGERVFGSELAGSDGRGDWLAHQHFIRLNRTSGSPGGAAGTQPFGPKSFRLCLSGDRNAQHHHPKQQNRPGQQEEFSVERWNRHRTLFFRLSLLPDRSLS